LNIGSDLVEQNISKKNEQFNIWDKPIPYKEGLLIYPVLMEDYLSFHIAVNCLLIEKNRIPDPLIISMSYLDFIFYLAEQNKESEIYLMMLIELFKICLKVNPDEIMKIRDERGKIKLIIKQKQIIITKHKKTFKNRNKKPDIRIVENDIEIDKNDFNNIKEIICSQNLIELPDPNIDPNLEKALKEAQEFKNKNKKKMCSLEDQLICVMIALGETDKSKFKNMTIRTFAKILERYDYKLHYEIYKGAECGGMISFKQEIDHWMTEIKKNKYEDVMVDYDSFKGKVSTGGFVKI
jgi:hypothetical protein